MFLKCESANDLIKLGESIFYSIEIYAVVEKSKTGLCFQIFYFNNSVLFDNYC